MELVKSRHDMIDRIEDNSDPLITRYWVYFKNGIILSVVRGFGSYGYEDGLFEINVINFDHTVNNFKRDDLSELCIDFDEPLGYLSQEDLVSHIIRIGSLKPIKLSIDNSSALSIIWTKVRQLIN